MLIVARGGVVDLASTDPRHAITDAPVTIAKHVRPIANSPMSTPKIARSAVDLNGIVLPVAVVSADLLFGSRLQGCVAASGYEPIPFSSPAEMRTDPRAPTILVADLGSGRDDWIEAFRRIFAAGGAAGIAVYAHSELSVRRRALVAGFHYAVPRSKFVRDPGRLLDRLKDLCR